MYLVGRNGGSIPVLLGLCAILVGNWLMADLYCALYCVIKLCMLLELTLISMCSTSFYVVDPDGNVNCSIVSTNLPTVTAAGGVIANGTQNVILYCICMRVDSIVIVGQTSWFFNGARITLTQDDGSGNPYSRNNVPSTLTIPSFGTPHDGNYSCGHRLSFDDVATLGDTITLTLPGMH